MAQLSLGGLCFACVFSVVGMAQAPPAEMVLHSFQSAPMRGANPYAGVIRDSAGNLFGTTYNGGAAGCGVVYKLDPAGYETVLYSFTGGSDGGHPYAGVIADSAGNLYGTASTGGAGRYGVVYKLDPGGKETVLHSFTWSSTDGAIPYAGVIRDAEGNLYGTTLNGGTAGEGVVYKLDAAGNFTMLYGFTSNGNGYGPYGGVTRDSEGNLYGTTYWDSGVYKIDAAGNYTVLHAFQGGPDDGGGPYSGVILDAAGNLYGTTTGGGADNAGVVYKLDATGQLTLLHSFAGGAEGANPYAGVILDGSGNLYGTTFGNVVAGQVVYRIDAAGDYTVLYQNTGGTYAGVIRDAAGNLYGTTYWGGYSGLEGSAGTVYKLDTAGQQTMLYGFPSGPGGYAPWTALTGDLAGNLYGTTLDGGHLGSGVAYKLDASGYTVLHTFTGAPDGANPTSPLIRDPAGNLYGTTDDGGMANMGVVYKLDRAGQETILHSFTGTADGAYPTASLIIDSTGSLYGVTQTGGAAGLGVVYTLNPAGQETVLHSFSGAADGQIPTGLTRDPAGNLYGTAWSGGPANAGVVYKLDTAGNFTLLYSFTGGADGGEPATGLIRDPSGNIYGTAVEGGTAGLGVIFKLDVSGHETVLYSFSGSDEPMTGVIRDAAGNLYGSTWGGGTSAGYIGRVYKLDRSGNFTVLYNFTGGVDGSDPNAPILGPEGNLYGTTHGGGEYGGGVIFAIKLTATAP